METIVSHPLKPEYLSAVKASCEALPPEDYESIVTEIEHAVSVVNHTMANAHDKGCGFLKLAIHPGSTQENMNVIYEKMMAQTPWKYRRAASSFVEAVDTLFKLSSCHRFLLEKLHREPTPQNEKILRAASMLTIQYVTKLLEQERSYQAS